MAQVEFPEALPISARVRDIAQAVNDHPVVIVAGETGSGKTTQLPKIALAMGRGLRAQIGVTQPRRIATTSVAQRVAEELGVRLGEEVGYQIRFANRTSPSTYVRFMTDGILLAALQGDPLLRAFDTLILDEAHERSLNVDLLLGVVKQILPRRPDLRVVISSATLQIERFSAFFGGAPVIEVSGRTFPVEVVHRPPTPDEEGDLPRTIANVIDEITILDPREDVLVFLPGEREIREAMDALVARALPHTEILPLYGRLSQAEQARVFARSSSRRIVLATNVAETSLTIPGIVYVVDAGLARINRHLSRTGVTRLHVEPISRASAEQRKGRAGRVRPGVCYRLYEAADLALRPEHTDPEILRVGLAGSILQMRAQRLGAIEDFPFLDPPPKRAIDEGYRVLEELGALDERRELTEIGQKLARLPVDPRIGRMILAGEQEGCLRELVILAAALDLSDPRERPMAERQRADQLHRRFRDESSDFASLLSLWRAFHEAVGDAGQSKQRRFCKDNLLSYVRMREWIDVHGQLVAICKDLGLAPGPKAADADAIHRALLPGLLSKVGMWSQEHRTFVGARQTRFQLHPSSALAKRPPPWIVAAELVETSQLFARTAAKIDPAWLEAAGGPLCRRHHGEASWSEKAAEAMIRESVSLFGLPIVQGRRVRLAPIDRAAARRLFLLHALVRGEWAPHPVPAFLAHNRAVVAKASELHDRARRSDLLADEGALVAFFEARVGEDVVNGKSFDAWRKQAEEADPRLLFLSLADVLAGEAEELSLERFPDVLDVGGTPLPLTYRFDPSADDDGVTVTVPLVLLPALDPDRLEDPIPGWRAEKIRLLLFGLPRALRKDLGDVDVLARTIADGWPAGGAPFLATLSRLVLELEGARIPPGAFPLGTLPPYLRLHVRVVSGGHLLGEGRDVSALQERLALPAREAWDARPRAPTEAEGLTSFGAPLPAVEIVEVAGARISAYPALVDAERGVSRRLFPSRRLAEAAHRGGLRRLLLLAMQAPLEKLEREVPPRVATSGLAEAGIAAPRRQVVLRALDEAFELATAGEIRDEAAFRARLAQGKGRLAASIADLGRIVLAIAERFDDVRRRLAALDGKPGAPRAALADVRSQLRFLVGPDLLTLPRARLVHLSRYLEGIGVRLERLPNGPQKDLSKLEPVAPLWGDWVRAREDVGRLDAALLEEHHWLLEELRIATFAPELRAAVPVSPQRVAERWKELCSTRVG